MLPGRLKNNNKFIRQIINSKCDPMAEPAYDETIYLKLEASGLVDRVSQLVDSKLSECGWKEQVSLACRKHFEENDSVNNLEDLVAGITPIAKSMVPDSVKAELMQELKKILKAIPATST